MAELDDKLNEIGSSVENLHNQLKSLSTKIKKLDEVMNKVTGLDTLDQLRAKSVRFAEVITKTSNRSTQLESAFSLAQQRTAAYKDKLAATIASQAERFGQYKSSNLVTLAQLGLADALQKEEQISKRLVTQKQRESKLKEQRIILEGQIMGIEKNRVARALIKFGEQLELFKTPGARMFAFGEMLMTAGKALTDLRDKVYKLQLELGTTFMSALTAGTYAIQNQIVSFFSGGPILSFQDTIDTINAFQKEFGGLLTADAARRIAQSAKDLGVSAEVYLKAQRSFLVVGGEVTKTAFITQFRNAGLTAAQALNFAANNANLVAIAGVKYADSLARAAANAQRIGVSLEKTEQFADNLVGDFEGGLERFSELRAMGVEVDFNRLAQVAAAGTPEEVFGELSRELGGNKALLENIQKNRFLKVAIEKDLGLSIADVTRMAGGEAAKSTEQTEQEKTRDALTKLTERLGTVASIIGGFISVIGTLMATALPTAISATIAAISANIAALNANTVAQGGKAVEGLTNAFAATATRLETLGTLARFGAGAAGLGIGIGGALYGRELVKEGKTGLGIGAGSLAGLIGGGLLALATGGTALPFLLGGALLGGGISATGLMGKAQGGLITGPGTATSDNIMTPTSPGEFVVNAKATDTYGTNFLNSVNKGAYQPQASAVSVDMSRVEAKLEILAKDTTVAKLVDAIGKIKINMSGYEVGNVALNDRSPLYTASPSQAV